MFFVWLLLVLAIPAILVGLITRFRGNAPSGVSGLDRTYSGYMRGETTQQMAEEMTQTGRPDGPDAG